MLIEWVKVGELVLFLVRFPTAYDTEESYFVIFDLFNGSRIIDFVEAGLIPGFKDAFFLGISDEPAGTIGVCDLTVEVSEWVALLGISC